MGGYGFCCRGGWDVVIIVFPAVMLIGIDNVAVAMVDFAISIAAIAAAIAGVIYLCYIEYIIHLPIIDSSSQVFHSPPTA